MYGFMNIKIKFCIEMLKEVISVMVCKTDGSTIEQRYNLIKCHISGCSYNKTAVIVRSSQIIGATLRAGVGDAYLGTQTRSPHIIIISILTCRRGASPLSHVEVGTACLFRFLLRRTRVCSGKAFLCSLTARGSIRKVSCLME
jgi:hypothetical protein